MAKKKTFATRDVKGILGIRQRTLDYWDECGVVTPDSPANGKGSERGYSYENLIELSVVMRLRDTGLSLQRIRQGLEYLRQFKRRPLRDVVLITDGKDLFEKRKDKQLVSVLRGGQMAFSVVFLGRIPEEIDTSIRKLEKKRKTG
jgi:DNA-binding transcriptional MerR regulator